MRAERLASDGGRHASRAGSPTAATALASGSTRIPAYGLGRFGRGRVHQDGAGRHASRAVSATDHQALARCSPCPGLRPRASVAVASGEETMGRLRDRSDRPSPPAVEDRRGAADHHLATSPPAGRRAGEASGAEPRAAPGLFPMAEHFPIVDVLPPVSSHAPRRSWGRRKPRERMRRVWQPSELGHLVHAGGRLRLTRCTTTRPPDFRAMSGIAGAMLCAWRVGPGGGDQGFGQQRAACGPSVLGGPAVRVPRSITKNLGRGALPPKSTCSAGDPAVPPTFGASRLPGRVPTTGSDFSAGLLPRPNRSRDRGQTRERPGPLPTVEAEGLTR